MFSSEIEAILQVNNKTSLLFKGVFPCDKIPKLNKNEPFCVVINTASSTASGEHWILFMKADKSSSLYYIDSLAKPPEKCGTCFYKAFVSLTTGYIVKKLTGAIQSNYSSLCGVYCIFFALY